MPLLVEAVGEVVAAAQDLVAGARGVREGDVRVVRDQRYPRVAAAVEVERRELVSAGEW